MSRSLVVAAAVLILVACGDKSTPIAGGTYARAYAGVCAAAVAADRGNTDDARRLFLDRAHQPIHELAAAAQTNQRASAARLLEAKQAVEAQLDEPTASLPPALRRLAVAMANAIDAIGQSRPAPCPN